MKNIFSQTAKKSVQIEKFFHPKSAKQGREGERKKLCNIFFKKKFNKLTESVERERRIKGKCNCLMEIFLIKQ